MGTTAETGRMGERAAAEFLRRAGYEICALNWRSGRYELDIVARKGDFVHFVEVKTRRADGLTPPEAAVTPQKFRALTRAALRYMAYTGEEREAQFDLIFGLFAPKDSGVEHLKALALVSRTMRDASICTKLRANADPAKLYAILTESRATNAAA